MSSTYGATQDGERNLGAVINAVALVSLVLATVFVALRILVRIYLVRWRLGWDDGAIVVAIVSSSLALDGQQVD